MNAYAGELRGIEDDWFGSLETDLRCPACGDPIDYCQGHGAIGDPIGADILRRHDHDDHAACHPQGCERPN